MALMKETGAKRKEAGKDKAKQREIQKAHQGKLAEIAEYCLYDVKITKMVHEYGAAYDHVYYTNRFGDKLKAEVDW